VSGEFKLKQLVLLAILAAFALPLRALAQTKVAEGEYHLRGAKVAVRRYS